MMPFFDDPQTLTYDIIAVQEPWRKSEFFITYLIYMGHGSTSVCFYINKRLAISSRNATHHNPDLCTIHLEIHSIGELHIHNIYNPVSSTTSPPGRLSKLEQALALFLSDEHLILGDFNYIIWSGEAWRQEAIVMPRVSWLLLSSRTYLLLKPSTITYDEAGCQSTIGLIFASSTCLITWKIPNDSE